LREEPQAVIPKPLVLVCVAVGGFAALGWETIWQIRTSLAIGVSSQATALVIAATMGGMAIGTGLAGAYLQRYAWRQSPFLLYGALELFIGLWGFFVHWQFELVARLDEYAFANYGTESSLVHVLLIAFSLGPPSVAMGASIPVLGLIARQTQSSLGVLYGINTLGAAAGTLLMAFVILPLTRSVAAAVVGLSALNACVACVMFLCSRKQTVTTEESKTEPPGRTYHGAWYLVAFVSGFSIFALEVVVFRAMKAAFFSTTYSFSVMLGSVLLSLGVGAYAARLLKKDRATASYVLLIAGVMLLGITPLIERMDALSSFRAAAVPNLCHFILAMAVIGPLLVVMGIQFPLLLDWSKSPSEWGLLHASNTVGAILGALCAAWILLPTFGLAPTSWLIAALLVFAGLVAAAEGATRGRWALAGAGMFALAYFGQSGIGKSRIVGDLGRLNAAKGYEILAYRETPDFTVSVVESKGNRTLFIDGFNTSQDAQSKYMAWMGRLPMLIHPDPQDALIICFGRGETADCLRSEGPKKSIDIVDISEAVFQMAPLFPINNDVLKDPRVHPIVMDGRSWMRRTTRQYDVITLEPMPPTFAGVNSLYCREFYALAEQKLRPGGTIAQWLPYHLLTPDQSDAIARTFIDVFPDSILWLFPAYRTGILVGKKGPEPGIQWYGLAREAKGRELTADEIRGAVQLDAAGLARYGKNAVVITDDNQYLAYGLNSREHDFDVALAQTYEKETWRRISEAKNARQRTRRGDGTRPADQVPEAGLGGSDGGLRPGGAGRSRLSGATGLGLRLRAAGGAGVFLPADLRGDRLGGAAAVVGYPELAR